MHAMMNPAWLGDGARVLSELWIGSLVKCSVVLVLALLALTVWRRSAAVTRHVALTVAMLSTLVIPLGSALWIVLGGSTSSGINAVQLAQVTVTGLSAGSAGVPARMSLPGWWTIALAVWLGGVLLLAIRQVAGHVRVRRVLDTAEENEDPALHGLFRQCIAHAGVRRPVSLLIHREQTVPFTCGVARPVVVLTERELHGNVDDTRRILLHELAHVKRYDAIANAISRWATVLFWVNPLVWLTARRLQVEQERSCDDLVLHWGESPADYAELLLDYARTLRRRLALVPEGIAFVRSHSLTARIRSVLDVRHRRLSHASRVSVIALVVVSLTSVVALSCVRTPTADKKADGETLAAEIASPDDIPSPDEFIPVDEMPAVVTTVQPEYPKSLFEEGISGDVWIRALVNIDGTVGKANVVNPNPHEEFNEAALKAAYKNEYKPARKDGKPVSIWVTYKVSFRIPGKEDEDC